MSTFSVNPLVQAAEAHRGRLEQTRENTARQAESFATITSHGVGEVQHTTVVTFDCTFVEKPSVAYCFSLDGDTLIDGYFPTSSGAVWKWQIDSRGFYVGAYVFFVITGDPSYDLEHYFTFAGIAIKDLPEYLMETT
jgi:hypothetical protein